MGGICTHACRCMHPCTCAEARVGCQVSCYITVYLIPFEMRFLIDSGVNPCRAEVIGAHRTFGMCAGYLNSRPQA